MRPRFPKSIWLIVLPLALTIGGVVVYLRIEYQRTQALETEVGRMGPNCEIKRSYRGPKAVIDWIEERQLTGAIEWLKSDVVGLNINDAPVDDAWLEKHKNRLRNTRFVILDGTEVTDAGLASLSRSTPRLEMLFVSRSPVTDSELAHFAPLPDLSSLFLSYTQVQGAGLVGFGACRKLQQLELEESPVDDKGLESLRGFVSLEILNLSRTAITDAGMVSLVKLTNLKALHLNETAITDAALPQLKSLPNLTKLDLDGTRVTKAAVDSLQASRPDVGVIFETPP